MLYRSNIRQIKTETQRSNQVNMDRFAQSKSRYFMYSIMILCDRLVDKEAK